MVSYKTIKLNDDIIQFNFYNDYVKITINSTSEYTRYHNEFLETLCQFNIPQYQLKKIRYWYYKNYKRIYPIQEYTTRYGRKINQPDHSLDL